MENSDCFNSDIEIKALYDKWSAEINADPYMSLLTSVYKKWLNELRSAHPYLLDEGIRNDAEKKYSNPYYFYIPKEWATAKNRIMIIGEEGYGNWGCGKQYGWKENTPPWSADSYYDIRLYHRDLILSQTKYYDLLAKREDILGLGKTDEYRDFAIWFDKLYHRKPFNTDFWRRIKAVYDLVRDNGAIIWNNLDKIFKLKNKNSTCALTSAERMDLHSGSIKLLEEEIRITKPTIVIFNGWYSTSIKAELGKIYDEFYKDTPLKDWDDSKVCTVTDDTVKYICAYHPAFRPNSLEGRFNNNKITYESFLLKTISDSLS